ncbi:MAG: T9SS type A sorting domain-containing protein [Saprospiraceae bacterium]
MKIRLIGPTFLCLLIAIINVNAQSWEKSFDEQGALSKAFDVVETSDGGYVTCGEVDLPTGAIRHYVKTIKVDEEGTELWSRIFSYNAINQEEASALVETTDGGFLIAGTRTYNTAQVFKISATGDSLWRKEYGQNGPTKARDIIVNPKGGYLIAGTKVLTSNPDVSTFWIASIDEEGTLLWQNNYPDLDAVGTSGEEIKRASNGDFLMAGTFQGGQAALLRIDEDGDQVWVEKYILSIADEGLSIIEMVNGNVLLGGYSTGFAGNTPFLLEVDANGMMIDQVMNIPIDLGAVTDIEKTGDDGYILTGSGFSFWGNIELQEGFILKLNGNLEAEWDSLLSSATLQGTAIAQTSDDGYIMSGYSGSGMLLKKIGGIANSETEPLYEKNSIANIYPNPTTENLFVEFLGIDLQENISLEIYTSDGRLIKSEQLTKANETISMKNLSSGNYTYLIKGVEKILQSGLLTVL